MKARGKFHGWYSTTPRMALIFIVLTMPAGLQDAAAQDDCYADCADGLAPVRDAGPGAGTRAPEFRARRFDPETGVVEPRPLDEWIDDRPVVLAFGSYT